MKKFLSWFVLVLVGVAFITWLIVSIIWHFQELMPLFIVAGIWFGMFVICSLVLWALKNLSE